MHVPPPGPGHPRRARGRRFGWATSIAMRSRRRRRGSGQSRPRRMEAPASSASDPPICALGGRCLHVTPVARRSGEPAPRPPLLEPCLDVSSRTSIVDERRTTVAPSPRRRPRREDRLRQRRCDHGRAHRSVRGRRGDRVRPGHVGDLALGEVRELVFCSLTTSPIRAAAIASVPGAVEPRSFGFEFPTTTLFEKLDTRCPVLQPPSLPSRGPPSVSASGPHAPSGWGGPTCATSMRASARRDRRGRRATAVDESIPIELSCPAPIT